MDPLTHALASYSLARAAFPRLRASEQVAMVLAGSAASLDFFTGYLGPSAYLQFHRTATHSLLAAFAFAALFTSLAALVRRRDSPSRPVRLVFLAALLAAFLHLALDVCQNEGIAPLWPFSPRRYQLDWTARLDLVVLAILLAGVLLPRLAGLVTEEIGARAKTPRGRAGAAIALAAAASYLGARGIAHSGAVAMLDSRSYHGESPHLTAAFGESVSPFRWHGIVETESALHSVDLSVAPGSPFDPEAGAIAYKPEPSAALQAARKSTAAKLFLTVARFPKASVEQTEAGYRIELRDFPYASGAVSGPHVAAVVETGSSAQILNAELIWDQNR